MSFISRKEIRKRFAPLFEQGKMNEDCFSRSGASRALSLLSEEIMKSDQFTDEEKLNYHAEINTIKSQLSKTLPDKGIIAKAWEKLKPLATVAGIASFFEKVRLLIELLLKSL